MARPPIRLPAAKDPLLEMSDEQTRCDDTPRTSSAIASCSISEAQPVAREALERRSTLPGRAADSRSTLDRVRQRRAGCRVAASSRQACSPTTERRGSPQTQHVARCPPRGTLRI